MNTSTLLARAASALMVLGIAGATHAQNGLIAYDGFGNGPRADLDGSTGGNGWTGPWRDLSGGWHDHAALGVAMRR